MDHVMKDCLMVSRQHRLADVCRRLHTPKISNIVVCGSSGEVHGVTAAVGTQSRVQLGEEQHAEGPPVPPTFGKAEGWG